LLADYIVANGVKQVEGERVHVSRSRCHIAQGFGDAFWQRGEVFNVLEWKLGQVLEGHDAMVAEIGGA
jgi:hypothetical protein